MALERGQAARDVRLVQAEQDSAFPILCETCLGNDPFVRMLKSPANSECKVCEKVYTGYRWKPGGEKARYKQTIICQSCAKKKNVCQTCLFDMEYGLPVQVRDELVSKPTEEKMEQLKRLANRRQAPYYDRNKARVCSFWVKGNCKRGTECPFLHEQVDRNEQDVNVLDSIRSRFAGKNDPLAGVLLEKEKKREAESDSD